MKRLAKWWVPALILLFGCVAAFLRFHLLGTTFQSSDNVELAVRILDRPGYAWMVDEPYGIFISLFVKLWAMLLSALDFSLTELAWKSSIALAGTLQVWAGWRVLRRMGASQSAALFGAGLLAVLPIHVFQSRYLWGYEVLGALFLLPAIAAQFDFWDRPSTRRGLGASLWMGLYLLSHGYFLPMAPLVLIIALVLAPGGAFKEKALHALKLMARHLLWLFPLLFFPLYRAALRHALAKKSQPGFYLDDHFMGFLGNLGWPLLLLMLGLVAWAWWGGKQKPVRAGLLWLAGLLYFMPLWFGTPPGITVVRGYMLAGSVLWVAAAAMSLDALPGKARAYFLAAGVVVGLWTGIGTGILLFTWKTALGTAVLVERGSVSRDPGTKAAGQLVRTQVQAEAHVMSIHRSLEPPNAWFYLGRRDSAWFDLDIHRSLARFRASADWPDVLVADKEQADSLGNSFGRLRQHARIMVEGEPKVVFYVRDSVSFPAGDMDFLPLNQAYDAALRGRNPGLFH